ncbi:MAG: shikimate kinase [Alphaproteobacteria bacterium]|nr:shikimate kinase [Alphaproteobacteria bacterium]
MGSLKRTVALVGMMGAGKSSLGRRLARRLEAPFRDADAEIEAAAGCTINQIFERYGEEAFRDCERKVIARLLTDPPHVLATGGGAFIDDHIREQVKASALSVWINVPLDVLVARVERRDTRPLLRNGNARDIVSNLLTQRKGIYAQADLTITGEDGPHGASVSRIMAALRERDMLG